MINNVLIFIGNEDCPHCREFKKQWAQLVKDPELTQNLYLKSFVAGPGESLPPCFDWVRTVPTILKCSVREYSQLYDVKTNKPVIEIPNIPKTVPTLPTSTTLTSTTPPSLASSSSQPTTNQGKNSNVPKTPQIPQLTGKVYTGERTVEKVKRWALTA